MRSRRNERQDYGYARTVAYDSRNHFSVMFQCAGSVWREVLPYCLFNVALTAFLRFLLGKGIDCTVSEWGHEFMSVLVSFLVITKFNLTLSVYYEMQKNLMIMGSATRQIVLMACTLTAPEISASTNDVASTQASWRFQVAHAALLMMSTTATMLTKANDWNAWEAPGMSEDERSQLQLFMDHSDSLSARDLFHHQQNDNSNSRHYEYGHNLTSDLNLRVPIRMAHKLQAAIASSRSGLDSIQVKLLLDQVGRFLDAFHGIRVYLSIPIPFSMVQMARIFLFFYTFTIPFAILSADLKLGQIQILLLVFIVTYGFMGIEIVCMHLDDPFGSDAVDLPVVEQANEVFEDVYLMLQNIDGFPAASRLRSKMRVRPKHPVATSEKDSLL